MRWPSRLSSGKPRGWNSVVNIPGGLGTVTSVLSGEFVCPLRRACLARHSDVFLSYVECNEAILRIRAIRDEDARADGLDALFQRLRPLIRKTLRRFCGPGYQGSRCEAGACYPEELVGESYLVLREAVRMWEPVRQVDFLGYFGQFLYWRLEHRARYLRRANRETGSPFAGDEWLASVPANAPGEDELLTRASATELLSRLSPVDSDLLVLASEGYTSRELAERAHTTAAGVRKRLQRIRERLGSEQ